MKKTFELRQERNFGAKISGAFEFIKQNFAGLAKPILYIALPFGLLAGYFFSEYFSFLFSSGQNLNDPYAGGSSEIFDMLFNQLGLLLSLLAGSILVICVIFSYLALYDEDKDRKISYSMVFGKLKKRFWRFLGFNVVYILALIVAFAVLIVVCVVLPVLLITQVPVLGIILYILMLGVLVLFVLFFMSILYILQNTLFFENLSVWKTFSRAVSLIKGHFWETIGLMIVVSFILNILSMVFIIPLYIIIFMSKMGVELGEAGKVMIIAISLISSFFSFLTLPLMQIPMSLQYFNLVEKKDGTGLIGQIEKIGQARIEQDDDV